jgi:recombination protein RecT
VGQLVQLTDQSKDIATLFKVNSQRMMRAAPKGFDPQRLLSVAFNAIAYNTDLLDCTRESLIGGAFEAIKLGLTLGGPMQEAWLIPFRNSRTGKREATFIVGYQGYRNLIDRARSTLDMHPRPVHNGMMAGPNRTFSQGIPDEFDYWFGDEPRILHRPKNPMPEFKEQLKAVYVVARLRGGGKQMEVLELEEIERHRNRSRAKDNGPWVTDYVPMALKTGIRKMAKYLPKASIELARAMALDNAADSGDDQDFDIEGIVIPPAEVREAENATPPRALEAMKERMRVPEPAQREKAPVGPPLTDEDINFGDRR